MALALSGPALVTLVDDVHSALPCEDAVMGDDGSLAALLDGEWHRWPADRLYTVKFLRPSSDDGRYVTLRRTHKAPLPIGEARAMYRRRPASLAERPPPETGPT
jgi:hypothetical protein